LWEVENYTDFLAARRELLAGTANSFLAGLRSSALPDTSTTLERTTMVADVPDDQDSRADEVAALITELTELGCSEPAVDSEIADPATGQVLAIAEACWPEGLQPGQGNPVVLELDPGEAAELARLSELGYEVFTSCDSLRGYVRRRNQEAAGLTAEVRAAFERAMKDVYVRAKKEANYTAGYFLTMLSSYGGLGTAHRLLASSEVSSGFTALFERGRLDLTVEALAVKPEFADLFTEDEVETARERLRQLGYL
jgi:hypothetical protein